MPSKKAQVWIETVIYTLIGITIMTVLLAIVIPKIRETQDQALIEDSLGIMNNIDSQIAELVFRGTGNSRVLPITVRKGDITFDGANDKITFLIETEYKYSEPGIDVEIGKVRVRTEEKPGEIYDVTLTLNYADSINLTWNNQNIEQSFGKAPTPYRIIFTNVGKKDDLLQVDIKQG